MSRNTKASTSLTSFDYDLHFKAFNNEEILRVLMSPPSVLHLVYVCNAISFPKHNSKTQLERLLQLRCLISVQLFHHVAQLLDSLQGSVICLIALRLVEYNQAPRALI